MVLLGAVLVVAASLTLVIGISQSSTPVVYLAIATSVIAAVLLVSSVLRRRATAMGDDSSVSGDDDRTAGRA